MRPRSSSNSQTRAPSGAGLWRYPQEVPQATHCMGARMEETAPLPEYSQRSGESGGTSVGHVVRSREVRSVGLAEGVGKHWERNSRAIRPEKARGVNIQPSKTTQLQFSFSSFSRLFFGLIGRMAHSKELSIFALGRGETNDHWVTSLHPTVYISVSFWPIPARCKQKHRWIFSTMNSVDFPQNEHR